jgi:predicted DNA-binding protein YlxM (UPF0122 family)
MARQENNKRKAIIIIMDDKEFEWLSVSELAKRENVSIQTIYNRIKENLDETMEFERKSMRGLLIKYQKNHN